MCGANKLLILSSCQKFKSAKYFLQTLQIAVSLRLWVYLLASCLVSIPEYPWLMAAGCRGRPWLWKLNYPETERRNVRGCRKVAKEVKDKAGLSKQEAWSCWGRTILPKQTLFQLFVDMQYLEESSKLRIIEYHHQSLQREMVCRFDYGIMSENSINI